MSTRFKQDPFGWHEALDRTYMIESLVNQFLVTHPVIRDSESLSVIARNAADQLSALYQKVGQLNPYWTGDIPKDHPQIPEGGPA